MNLYQKNLKLIENNEQYKIKRGFCNYTYNYLFPDSKEDVPGLILPLNEKQMTIHSKYYPRRESYKWISNQEIKSDKVIIFGLGLGYYLEYIHELNLKEIVIIEPDKHLFMKALHYVDLSQMSSCSFLIGFDEFEVVNYIPENKEIFQILQYNPIVQFRKQYFENLAKRIRSIPIYSFDCNWKYKKFSQDKTKALFIDCSYVLSRECIVGLQQNNCEVEYLHLDQQEFDYEEFVRKLLFEINAFKPDFVLTVNHLGFDAEGRLTELFESLELPFASWFVDSPTVILSTHNNNVSDLCSVFVWDRDYIQDVKDAGFKHVHYLPLATMPDLFKPLNLPFQFDVSFVGSSMVNAVHKNMKRMVWRSDLVKLLEVASEKFLEIKSRYVSDTIDVMEDEGVIFRFESLDQRHDFEAAVLWRATQKYRFSGVKKLVDFYPAIHGDPGWDDFLDHRYRIGREIMYYDNMPEFYNVSKINFNMTSCQMKNAVNQRVFDVPACGQFLLTDYKSQLDEIFAKDEIVFFNSIEEIPDLVRYYLDNEAERNQIANKAHNKIIKNETYKHRLAVLIKEMKRAAKENLC